MEGNKKQYDQYKHVPTNSVRIRIIVIIPSTDTKVLIGQTGIIRGGKNPISRDTTWTQILNKHKKTKDPRNF